MSTIRSKQNKDREKGAVRGRFRRFLDRWERYRGYPTLITTLLCLALYFAVRTFKGDDQPVQLRFTESASEQTKDHETLGVPPSKEILSGQAYETALRLRESGALLMAVSLSAFEDFRIHSRFPSTTDAILTNLQKHSLLPPGLDIKDRTLRSSMSEISVNYRDDPFSFEILSLPAVGTHGPAFLFRVPIPAGEKNAITYFRLSAGTVVRIPSKFSSVEQLVASGWSIAHWRGEALPLDDSALRDLREHELWLKSLNPNR